MNRYIYVFVSGGLNDILCQIKQALDYAYKYNRVVIFNKSHHQITFEFWNIFDIQYPDINIIDNIDFPKINRKQLNYKLNYSENVIPYYNPTGGEDSFHLFKHIKLKLHIIKKFNERLKNLGDKYDGIHIRNTDIKSDIDGLLCSLDFNNNSKIFLSTDDINTFYRFKKLYGKQIYSFSKLIDVSAYGSLHHCDKLDKKTKNMDAVLDLLCLGNAEKLYCAKMLYHPSISSSGRMMPSFGGYSRLAMYLHKNKNLIDNMIKNYIIES